MKSPFIFLLLFLLQHNAFPQSAQSYFPTQTGFKWTYRVNPLDSLNNPINLLAFYQADSLAVVKDYEGRAANYILSKSGTELTLPFTPFSDTSYLSFQSNDAYKYYRLFNLDSLLGGIGNRNVRSMHPFESSNIEAFEGWFAYYKFAQNVNINYQIFSKDTSITIDSLTIPIRYELKGKRLTDQTITTELGNFTCKKFLLTTVVSYLPLPILPIPLYQMLDTSWIAPGNWIVKQIFPSSAVNLSAIGLGTFTVPGNMKEIIPALVTGIHSVDSPPINFMLYQNFPNPFNPVTKIRYLIPTPPSSSPLVKGRNGVGFVSLKVYGVLGNEVATLVNEYKVAGSYEVEFEASKLSSGIYYYQLRASDYIETKKTILLK